MNNSENNIIIEEYTDKYKGNTEEFIRKSCIKYGISVDKLYDLDDIQMYYIDNGGMMLIAYDTESSEIVGTIGLHTDEGVWLIKRSYIEETYQNKGLGSRLYKSLLDYIINNTEIKELQLTTSKENDKAIKYWSNKGFNICDTTPSGRAYIMINKNIR